MGSSTGAVYVLAGNDSSQQQAVFRSSKLLRYFSPGLEQTILIDDCLSRDMFRDSFDVVGKLPRGTPVGMSAKILAMEYTSYKRTLVLDNDILPVGDLVEGFCYIGEHRQMALSLSPRQEISVGDSNVTHFQNGVMFIYRTSRVLEFFKTWYQKVCKENPTGPTRFIFSNLLSGRFKDIGIYPLSYYWNFRIDLLLDFDPHPKQLSRVLPLIRAFHTHLRRKHAINIIRQYPRIKLIREITKDQIYDN